MTTEPLQAVNCRIPKDVYNDMQDLLSNTQKSTAAFVKDSIEFYIGCVKRNINVDDFKPLKIDQFAYDLDKKNK
jgi:predicted DNA-binding protein